MITDEKCRQLPVLKKQAVTWVKNDSFPMSYPVYDGPIRQWLDKFKELGLCDIDYTRYNDSNGRKDIEQLDRDRILAYIVFLIRSEHFGGTRFAEAVENGTLEALCLRLHETVK
ncbi:DUF6508 domain-containing protein [Ruminococcus sp.]|uniref:DUF6508 domain-containing protein n=1 Tax=Ruminococcus sp. TaxID=41978 RepID=UPI0025FEC6B5|nr:DUF6508 domain-containing protein [Ruminococcus sp.]MBQ8966561.1 hypothetical protein [Ruminococcus sp.]